MDDSNCKDGASSWDRAVGVTQKTAWFMLQRIRLAMQDDTRGGKRGGDVEVAETFLGGRARNMYAAKRKRLGISQSRSAMRFARVARGTASTRSVRSRNA